MPMTEEDTRFWCSWCGSDLPDHRLHTNTCSQNCTNSLSADDLRRQRAAGIKPRRGRPKLAQKLLEV